MKKKIRRFPRTRVIDGDREFSMSRIYETLYKIAQGEPVKSKREELACRWFGLRTMPQESAKALLAQSKGAILRYPRTKNGGSRGKKS